MLVLRRTEGQSITCRHPNGEIIIVTHVGYQPLSRVVSLSIRGDGPRGRRFFAACTFYNGESISFPIGADLVAIGFDGSDQSGQAITFAAPASISIRRDDAGPRKPQAGAA
jgi:hypothetical protein